MLPWSSYAPAAEARPALGLPMVSSTLPASTPTALLDSLCPMGSTTVPTSQSCAKAVPPTCPSRAALRLCSRFLEGHWHLETTFE